MANPQQPEGSPPGSTPPEDPKLNDTWVDDVGDLYTWDGTDWVPFEDIAYFEPNTSFRDLR
jgi:hypothetical protein